MAITLDGGSRWQLAHAPVITLPRPYVKDAALAGYGELGTMLWNEHDRFWYGHVSRSYRNGTGAGPPGTVGRGSCVFRTRSPGDPSTLRGWNGTAWGTEWADPYTNPTPEAELWKRTCAAVDQGQTSASHLNPKKFAGRLTAVPGWPTHVMTALPPGKRGARVQYYFPSPQGAADGPAPFSAWLPAPAELALDEWIDPCTIGQGIDFMYPNLLDHDSPFGLAATGGGELDQADGLSYALVGNRSLHVYAVVGRKLIIRVPVAWFQAGDALPPPLFPPPPPPQRNPPGCAQLRVTGAAIAGVNGVYVKSERPSADGSFLYTLDAMHQLYRFQAVWKLAHHGLGPVYYSAARDAPGDSDGVPIAWGSCGDLKQIKVRCVDTLRDATS